MQRIRTNPRCPSTRPRPRPPAGTTHKLVHETEPFLVVESSSQLSFLSLLPSYLPLHPFTSSVLQHLGQYLTESTCLDSVETTNHVNCLWRAGATYTRMRNGAFLGLLIMLDPRPLGEEFCAYQARFYP